MNDIPIEHRVLEPKKINIDLINHLRDRYTFGPAAIITDNPRTFLSTFRKQWVREMAFLTKARASTLDAAKIAQISRELLVMEILQFDARGSGGNSADIYLLSPEQLELIPTNCATIYICSIRRVDLNEIVAPYRNRHIQVVDYGHASNEAEDSG